MFKNNTLWIIPLPFPACAPPGPPYFTRPRVKEAMRLGDAVKTRIALTISGLNTDSEQFVFSEDDLHSSKHFSVFSHKRKRKRSRVCFCCNSLFGSSVGVGPCHAGVSVSLFSLFAARAASSFASEFIA